MEERWLPVVNYEGIYEVSDQGRVRSLDRKDARGRQRRGRMRSLAKQPSGHLTVALCRERVQQHYQVHWLVLEAFVGPRPAGMFGCHWDDDPSNNHLDNLRWATRSENVKDSVRNGTHHMARRTHCPQGHEYTPENTYRKPSGQRYCRECRRAYKEAHRDEIRAKNREYGQRKRDEAKANAPAPAPRTHCQKGHPWVESNLYVAPDGTATCLTCKRLRAREHYLANRAKYIEKAADWVAANPERAREITREAMRRRRALQKAS